MTPNPWITAIIVTITFAGIAVGRYPIIKSNRTTISLMGVAMLILFGQIRFDDIPNYLDFNTLILLFSMMIINANLKLAGFFSYAGQVLVRYAKTPCVLLAVEIGLAGILSALFLNDTICLMFTPLVISLTDSLKRNPLPYLIGLATAANVGSTATLTGNPQNMIVGIASGIRYLDFTLALLPVAVLGLAVIWLVLIWIYPHEFRRERLAVVEQAADEPITRPLLIKTLVITAGLLVAFLAGAPIAMASFIAASILLVTRRHQPQTVFAEFDWSLLVFFSGLFIVSGSLETSGVTTSLMDLNALGQRATVWNLSAVSAVLSNLVSNVPAVLLLRPVVSSMTDQTAGWLTLAASSTLAGNLTLLGSVANLIVAESASHWRVVISFWEYTRAGIIITLVTLLMAAGWLSLGLY